MGAQQRTVYDFGRSYLRFRSDRVNHTPRLQLDAACTVHLPDGSVRQFVLTSPCIGENMYVDEGMIQEPICEFVMIAEHRSEYAIMKWYADAARDVHQARRFGEAMPTASGVPARVTTLDVHLARCPTVEPIVSHAAFEAAVMANRAVIGRTTYQLDDGGTTVVLDYPCKTVNVAHGRTAWQVDAGPVLVPRLTPSPVAAGTTEAEVLFVARLGPAFAVFNRWDRVEITPRGRVTLGAEDGGGPTTSHYRGVVGCPARNALFAAD